MLKIHSIETVGATTEEKMKGWKKLALAQRDLIKELDRTIDEGIEGESCLKCDVRLDVAFFNLETHENRRNTVHLCEVQLINRGETD